VRDKKAFHKMNAPQPIVGFSTIEIRTASVPFATMSHSNQKLLATAPDLTRRPPRSPQTLLGGYALAARALDKCRASLAGRAGPYHFNCCVDRDFLKFSGIKAQEFEQFVASGATDSEVAIWIATKSRVKNPGRVAAWSVLVRLNPLLYALNFDDWIYSRKVQSGKPAG
jgi:hypothetical protein